MGDRKVVIRAVGKPAPQGSKNVMPNGQMKESSPDLWPWRGAVSMAAAQEMATGHEPFTGPVDVMIVFLMKRPPSIKRPFPSVAPDLDKLLRSTNDALTDAGVWNDDSQVCSVVATKEYAKPGTPSGALIVVRELLP